MRATAAFLVAKFAILDTTSKSMKESEKWNDNSVDSTRFSLKGFAYKK